MCYFTPIAERYSGTKEVVLHSFVHSLEDLFHPLYSEKAGGATWLLHAGKTVVYLACSAASKVGNDTFYSAALPQNGPE